LAQAEVKEETITFEHALRDPKCSEGRFTFRVSWREWFVLSRTLCYALSLDDQLRESGPPEKCVIRRFWANEAETADLSHKVAESLLDRLLLLPRRSSVGYAAQMARYGIKVDFRQPDYRESRWHDKREAT